MTVESLADSFLKEHLRSNPDLELIKVHCHVDKPKFQLPSKSDIHDYISSLEEESVRYDATETDTDIPLSVENRLILARRQKTHYVYVAGLHRTGRVLFTKDPRLAQVFESEEAVITQIFQFTGVEEDMMVLREMFNGLSLEMIQAPTLVGF